MKIVRHSEPNQYDQAPKGTICVVIPEETGDQYIQRSDDSNNPRWEKV